MYATTYVVLSFDLSSRSGFCTHQAFRRFDDLSRAMMFGADELLIRNGVLIVRSVQGDGSTTPELQPVAACGVAEQKAVALYAVADFKLGRWPAIDDRFDPSQGRLRRA
jgi:hypothetical protein